MLTRVAVSSSLFAFSVAVAFACGSTKNGVANDPVDGTKSGDAASTDTSATSADDASMGVVNESDTGTGAGESDSMDGAGGTGGNRVDASFDDAAVRDASAPVGTDCASLCNAVASCTNPDAGSCASQCAEWSGPERSCIARVTCDFGTVAPCLPSTEDSGPRPGDGGTTASNTNCLAGPVYEGNFTSAVNCTNESAVQGTYQCTLVAFDQPPATGSGICTAIAKVTQTAGSPPVYKCPTGTAPNPAHSEEDPSGMFGGPGSFACMQTCTTFSDCPSFYSDCSLPHGVGYSSDAGSDAGADGGLPLKFCN